MDVELPQGVFHRVGDEQDRPVMRTEDAFGDAVIEEGEHGGVEAGRVEQEDGLGVQFEGLPGEDLEEFLEGSEAPGQNDEGVRALAHQRLTGVHGAGDVKLGETIVGDLEIDEHLGDDADDVTSGLEGSLGEGAHETDTRATVDEANVVPGKRSAEGLGLLAVDGAGTLGGGAEDSNVANRHIVPIVSGTERGRR
jgi:hypothetical protein